MCKLVVFDMDGTILDTLGDLQMAGNYALNIMGFPIHTREAYRSFIGKGLVNQMTQSLPEGHRNPKTVAKLTEIYLPYYANHIKDNTYPFDGVQNMLAKLKQHGILLAVLSNKPDKYVATLAEYFFPGTFDKTMGKIDGIPLKPDPTSVKMILAHFDISREDCIFVGDSGVDIQTAKNAGLRVVAVSWGFSTKNALSEFGDIAIIDDPNLIFKFIIDNKSSHDYNHSQSEN